MQAMNAAVRNAGFALAFFAASVVLLPALCWRMDAATDVLRCALPWRACSVTLADWRWRTGIEDGYKRANEPSTCCDLSAA